MASEFNITMKIMDQIGLKQKEAVYVVDLQASNFSKIEYGQRDNSMEELNKIAQFFGMTADEIFYFGDVKMPISVKVALHKTLPLLVIKN